MALDVAGPRQIQSIDALRWRRAEALDGITPARDRDSIERFLHHQCLWSEPLGLAEARPPPYFRSITRVKPTAQTELFLPSRRTRWSPRRTSLFAE